MASCEHCDFTWSQLEHHWALGCVAEIAGPHIPGEALLRALFMACPRCRFRYCVLATIPIWVQYASASLVWGSCNRRGRVLAIVRRTAPQAETISSLCAEAISTVEVRACSLNDMVSDAWKWTCSENVEVLNREGYE